MSKKQVPALLKPQPPQQIQTAAAKPAERPDRMMMKEVEPSRTIGPASVRHGRQGRPVIQTALYDLPTPGEFTQMMRGVRNLDEASLRKYAEFAELLEEIEPQYGALLDARKKSAQRKKWFIESADDSKQAIEIAEFARKLFSAGWFRQFIFDALDAKGKGLSVLKKLYVKDEGGWTIGGMQHIPLAWLKTSEDGRTLMLRDAEDPKTGIELDSLNYVTHSAKRKSGLAIRGGFAVPVGALALGKINGWNWTLELLEQYGIPFRKAEYPDGTPYEDVVGLQMAMESMGRNGYLITKKGMTFDTLDGLSRGGSADAQKWFLEYCDKSIAKLIAGVTEASEGGGGSNAKAQAQLTVRDDIVCSDLLELEETVQSQILDLLVKLRFGDNAPVPLFKFHLEREIPLKDFIEGVEKFVGMGGKVQMSDIRDRLQLAEPQAESELLHPNGQGPAEPALTTSGLASLLSASSRGCSVHGHTAAAERDRIDELADQILTQWDTASAPLSEHLAAAMASAGDPATRRERILEAVQNAPLDELVSLFASARVKTHAAGRAGGEV